MQEISKYIWETRYRASLEDGSQERSIADSWQRIAEALATVEPVDSEGWQQRFLEILQDFRFLPGGRIQHGAGTNRNVTLFNCFVMGPVEDTMDGIFQSLKESALTMQAGGGIGCDFSTLRPRGSNATESGTTASGPVSFMRIWDSMCATLISSGNRRGAMMATMHCAHPDILEFVNAKSQHDVLSNFNLSVLVTDDFMRAVRNDDEWHLRFPVHDGEKTNSLPARTLWQQIINNNYNSAEPGVLFIDTINHMNNLYYREHISATNPCGEIPLPPYGACNLGSVNLTRFIQRPFQNDAAFDMNTFNETVAVSVRLLDNVIDISRYPLPEQAAQATTTRRLGLGITGLADALVMLGLGYDSTGAREMAANIMKNLCHTAYVTSIDLAEERGVFPAFEKKHYMNSPFIRSLPDDIKHGIEQSGIRNSHLTAVAPAGTISLLAGNISSGLEPIFAYTIKRRIRDNHDRHIEYEVDDYAYNLWREKYGDKQLPAEFMNVSDIQPEDHLAMQAALQPYVDSAISKTINVPADCAMDRFLTLYDKAYDLGLKGCTTYRPTEIRGNILTAMENQHCCSIDREAD
jgi:ribonucleoside-diphosphate reductase alpha chain